MEKVYCFIVIRAGPAVCDVQGSVSCYAFLVTLQQNVTSQQVIPCPPRLKLLSGKRMLVRLVQHPCTPFNKS